MTAELPSFNDVSPHCYFCVTACWVVPMPFQDHFCCINNNFLDWKLAMSLKSLPLIAILTAPFFISPASANDKLVQSFCSYIAANDKNNLRKILSENRLRLKNVYDGITCNGLPMIRFAIKHNAGDAAEFIIKQLPGSQISSMGDAEWAANNGFASSSIIETLKARSAS